jgi:hypothetical protein
MATQILTRVLCDFCNADDTETPGARTESVTIGGDTYEIDVCDTHGKPLTELAETLSALGRKIPKSGKRQRDDSSRDRGNEPARSLPMTCPVEGCGHEATRKLMNGHARQVHGKTLGELEGNPVDYVCPVEGCGAGFTRKQSLAVHVGRAHENR